MHTHTYAYTPHAAAGVFPVMSTTLTSVLSLVVMASGLVVDGGVKSVWSRGAFNGSLGMQGGQLGSHLLGLERKDILGESSPSWVQMHKFNFLIYNFFYISKKIYYTHTHTHTHTHTGIYIEHTFIDESLAPSVLI